MKPRTASLLQFGTSLLTALAVVLATGAESPGRDPAGRIRPPSRMEIQPSMEKYWPDPLRFGLVFVEIKVGEKGEVLDARVGEGGYHDRETAQSALQIARRIRLRPATRDGNPVEWTGTFPVRFIGASLANSTRAVSPEFRVEADKVQSFLENKDFSGAHFHAQWMLAEKVHNDYEYAILQTTLADTFARNSGIHRALMVIRDVTRRSTFRVEEYEPGGPLPAVELKDFALWRTPFELEHMLRLRFILAESQGLYLDALRAHADLQALGFVKPDDPTLPRFQSLLRKVQDSPTLTGHVKMEDRSTWPYPLWHSRFRVDKVRNGKIDEVVIACAGHNRTMPFAAGEDMRIPEGAGTCVAAIKGTPGTEFDITEFRDGLPDPPASTTD